MIRAKSDMCYNYTSIISIAELYEGVYGSRHYKARASLNALETFLAGITVLPIGQDACKIFGRKRNKLRKEQTHLCPNTKYSHCESIPTGEGV
jgi:predicted nucleic acid-binding protein